MSTDFWTAEEIAVLERLAREGYSAGQMTAEIKRSRNAILGKLMRLSIPLRTKPHTRAAAVKRAPKPAKKPAPKAKPAVIAAPPKVEAAPVVLPVVVDPVVAVPNFAAHASDVIVVPLPFSRAIEENRCLFFAADAMSPASPDMLVCGCPRGQGLKKPYCRTHARLETTRVAA